MAKKLKPTAQAVLDAWTESENGVYLLGDPKRLANTFRAIVKQFTYERRVHPDSFLTEEIIDADDILALADELDSIS